MIIVAPSTRMHSKLLAAILSNYRLAPLKCQCLWNFRFEKRSAFRGRRITFLRAPPNFPRFGQINGGEKKTRVIGESLRFISGEARETRKLFVWTASRAAVPKHAKLSGSVSASKLWTEANKKVPRSVVWL